MTSMENRLSLIAQDLSTRIYGEPAPIMRKIALIVSRFAINETRLRDPIIEEAFSALDTEVITNASLRERLGKFVERLDQIQWDLKELVDEGEIDKAEYLAAFSKARAANALYFALDPNEYIAATESIYEANAATNELATLKRLALRVLDE